jgi:Acyl-CoA reductase (LuxC)
VTTTHTATTPTTTTAAVTATTPTTSTTPSTTTAADTGTKSTTTPTSSTNMSATATTSTTPRVNAITVRRAGWLPGLHEDEVAEWQVLRYPELEVQFPRLTPAGLAAQLERVASARDEYLRDLPVSRIVTLLDRVASRWLDPASPYRREAERLLPAITGYAEPAVRKGLASYLSLLREENLLRLLDSELSDLQVLDEFRPRGRGGGETRAFGPRLTVHVWSGNVPGLPLQSLVASLLVKSASMGKVASDEPLVASLFAESVAEVDERLAACLAVAYWPGGDATLESVAFDQAEAVIAYGSQRSVESVRSRVPAGTRFVPYGHKLSFGAIAREALERSRLEETAELAAYDAVKYDQQGCLSPHLFYVEQGGAAAPLEFAAALGMALERYAALVPRGRVSLEEAASAASARNHLELRQIAGEDVALFDGDGWAVLYDADPLFQASCLNRTVWVKSVRSLEVDVPRLVEPVRRYLQTCGVAAAPDRVRVLAERLGRLGVDRVCPLGRMGDPAPEWHHDGRFNVLDLVRWTDLEPRASAGRWEFSHPELGLYGLPSDAEDE